MLLMQLIKRVLDDAYAEISHKNKDDEIKSRIQLLSRKYHRLGSATDSDLIDYSCPITRFAYIYKYTVAHADYVMQLVTRCDAVAGLFQKKSTVRVACLGGGPGSDFLGILKHMIKEDSDSTLLAYLYDKERAWGDSWGDVATLIGDQKFQIITNFNQMDVTDKTTWKSYAKLSQTDLFTLSFFMSEVYKIRSSADEFFEHCISTAKDGALFLYIDNGSSSFYGWFDQLASKHGLKNIKTGQCEMSFSNEEEKRDLEPYFSKFDWPKRKSDVAYRIAKKV
jgi:hypothetical protein